MKPRELFMISMLDANSGGNQTQASISFKIAEIA